MLTLLLLTGFAVETFTRTLPLRWHRRKDYLPPHSRLSTLNSEKGTPKQKFRHTW